MDAEANITMPPMTKNAQAIKKSRSNASFDPFVEIFILPYL